jgi:hypothetical protein
VPLHERLGEVLGRFELRSRLARPEDGQPAGAENVHDAVGERPLRADDGEVDLLAFGEQRQRIGCGQRQVAQPRLERGAGIAGCDEDGFHAPRLRKPPCHCMLTPPAADDQTSSRTRQLRPARSFQGGVLLLSFR